MTKHRLSIFTAFIALSSLGLGQARAYANPGGDSGLSALNQVPQCLSSGAPLAVNDAQVVQWKTSMPNQYLARAHVSGTVGRVFSDENGHNHFELVMGPSAQDTIEVVYSMSFGALPNMQEGMTVEACGDFINSFAQAGHYPPSPDGAIIHWVHRNPQAHGHESGFLVVNGVVYGQGNGHGD